jgi:hypothetical protein
LNGRAVANVRNINGLLELLIWGVHKEGAPPYTIRITGVANAPRPVSDEIVAVQKALAEAREESIRQRGFDVLVRLEIVGRS